MSTYDFYQLPVYDFYDPYCILKTGLMGKASHLDSLNEPEKVELTHENTSICHRHQEFTALCLRTTVPLCCYGHTSLRSESACCRNLEKKLGVTKKIREREGVKILKGLTEKSVIFTALATFHCQFSLFLSEVEQEIELFRLVTKDYHHRRKVRKNDNF